MLIELKINNPSVCDPEEDCSFGVQASSQVWAERLWQVSGEILDQMRELQDKVWNTNKYVVLEQLWEMFKC